MWFVIASCIGFVCGMVVGFILIVDSEPAPPSIDEYA